MKKLYSLALITTLVILASCKTASKAYDKGDYDEAVEIAVKKLQKDPNDGELKSILRKSYKEAIDEHQARIRQHNNSNSETKWESIYHEYVAMQRLHDNIRRSPEAFRVIQPTDYSSHLETYRDQAADLRLEKGKRWMDRDDRESYKKAYVEFREANRIRPNHSDTRELLEEAYEMAVINVVVLPMNDMGYRFSSQYRNELNQIENELIRNLQYQGRDHFTRFYSEYEARNKNVRVDQFIDFRLTTLNLGRAHDENNTREVSKEVVIKETVYKPDSVVKQYGRVYARITTTRRTLQSEGNLQVNIRDASGRYIWGDLFRGRHNWVSEFATYTGDERALSDTDRQLVNRQPERAPFEEDILRHILREISSDMQGRISNYYR